MTPREKAVAVLGHQEGCYWSKWAIPPGSPDKYDPTRCTCDFPLHVLIAAERDRLRKEHSWGRWGHRGGEPGPVLPCEFCGEHPITRHPGPCAEPLTPAVGWWVMLACHVAAFHSDKANQIVFGGDFGADFWNTEPTDELMREHFGKAFLALAEAGLLRRDDAD